MWLLPDGNDVPRWVREDPQRVAVTSSEPYIWQGAVRLGDDLRDVRPSDGKRRVVPTDAGGMARDVGWGDVVEQRGFRLQRHEPVSKAFGDIDGIHPAGGKFDPVPSPVGGSGTQIDCHIESPARNGADELCLGKGRALEMQTTKREGGGVGGKTRLHWLEWDTRITKLIGAEGPGKSAPGIRMGRGLHLDEARQRRGVEDHRIFNSGTAVTKRPPQSRIRASCSITSGAMFQGRITR